MQGRAVKKREHGYGADITTLGRVRTALVLDRRLPEAAVKRACKAIDVVVKLLGDFNVEIGK